MTTDHRLDFIATRWEHLPEVVKVAIEAMVAANFELPPDLPSIDR